MEKLRLLRTCGACPEQYDAYLGDDKIGYLRLRHGYFRAEYRGEIVYESYPQGDGMFGDHERAYELRNACNAIMDAHKNVEAKKEEEEFTIEYPQEGRD